MWHGCDMGKVPIAAPAPRKMGRIRDLDAEIGAVRAEVHGLKGVGSLEDMSLLLGATEHLETLLRRKYAIVLENSGNGM